MNYEKIYFALIEKAKTEELNEKRSVGYFEKHHIKPKSLGGTNDENNLVKLTAREHFIAHALLIRFLTGDDLSKMKWAFHQLCTWSVKNKHHKTKYINARLYESFKRDFQKGENNSQFGTHWCYNTLTGEIAKCKDLPGECWVYGRCKPKPESLIKRIKPKSPITEIEFKTREQLILNANVDLTKFGWVEQVNKVTSLTRRQIYYVVNNSVLLQGICYRRKTFAPML